MKYRFLLISSLLASATVFGQAPANRVKIAPETNKQLEKGQAPYLINEGATKSLTEETGPVLFEDDFSNGAGQWANASLNSSGAVWVYRGPSTTPSNTTGSQGAYAAGSGVIASATPTNGFMIFDSDWYDNGGTAGNFGGGSQPAPHAGALTSPDIDCSSESGVLLTFHSYYRQYDAHGYVIVTNDNFATSDTVYDASDFHDVNTAGPANEFVKVNITDIAAGSSTVKVRFLFLAAGVANPSGYYFWQLDDISVVGAADFDLAVEETYFRGAGSWNKSALYSNYYYNIPQSQASETPMQFGAAIVSNSDAPMTNSTVTATVTGAGTYSADGNPVTYNIFGVRDTVNVNGTFTANNVGNYQVEFSVAADSADDYPDDNSLSKEFNVTERTFSWDDGEVGGGISWSNGSHSMYALMEFSANDTVSAIEFGIWSSPTFASDDGAVVEVGIWAADVTNDSLSFQLGTPVVTPQFRVMTASEYTDGTNNNLIRVAYSTPVAVPAGLYFVGYKRSSGTIRTATSDYGWTPLGAHVDVDSDGTLEGWTANLPIIQVETWSSDVCANTNIAVGANITCNPDEWTATIETAIAGNGTSPYAYSWSTGSTAEDITVDTEGTYTLSVVDANFCTGGNTFTVANGDIACNLATGKLGNASFDFSVMPNPSNGQFTIAFEAASTEKVNLEVQSLKGDVVFSQSMNIANGTTKSLDMSGTAAGVYIMKVSNEKGTSFQKIIIE